VLDIRGIYLWCCRQGTYV